MNKEQASENYNNAETHAAEIIAATTDPVSQKMIAWAKNSIWFAEQDGNLKNAIKCCLSDAADGDYNRATKYDVAKYRMIWKRACNAAGVPEAEKLLQKTIAEIKQCETTKQQPAKKRIPWGREGDEYTDTDYDRVYNKQKK